MSEAGPEVLVTDGADGRGRDVLVAVRGLAAAGYRPVVTVVTPSWRSAPSRHCARRVLLPPAGDPAYAAGVRAELASGRYVAAVAASEDALVALGVPVPRLLDKTTMGEAAEAAGLPVPPSRRFDDGASLLAAAGTIEFPVVVKPAVRRYWAYRADGPGELHRGMECEGPVVVQPYVDAPLRAVSGVLWRGELVAAVHERWLRIWPQHCGLASAAETVPPDLELERRLVALLDGYDGIFCAQLVGPYLIDVNLRIHSSHPLAVAAGVNVVALYCDLRRGIPVAPVRAAPGVFYRWLEGDVRHVVRAVRDGRTGTLEAIAALRPRAGTAHGTQLWQDPLPVAARLWAGVERRMARRSAGGAPRAAARELGAGA